MVFPTEMYFHPNKQETLTNHMRLPFARPHHRRRLRWKIPWVIHQHGPFVPSKHWPDQSKPEEEPPELSSESKNAILHDSTQLK